MRRLAAPAGSRSRPARLRARPAVSLRVRARAFALACGLALLFAFGAPGAAQANSPQTLPEDQIKAGFLFNFTRFVEWNQSAFASSASPLLLCVLDNAAMTDLLTAASAGKVVDGRSVAIRSVKAADDLRSCQVLFLSAADQRKAARILAGVKGKAILTVGESPTFLRSGGIVNFALQDDRVKLELELDSATRVGLKISAKLIAVSKLVSVSSDGSN